MAAIQQHEERHVSQVKKVERVQFLATTFEFPHLLAATHKMMRDIIDETEELRRVWGIARETREYFASCREQLWANLKPEDMEDAAKGLQKRLKTGGTKKTKASGTFRGLDKQIRDFLNTTPLVAALRHKSMRPRHWALLMTGAFKWLHSFSILDAYAPSFPVVFQRLKRHSSPLMKIQV